MRSSPGSDDTFQAEEAIGSGKPFVGRVGAVIVAWRWGGAAKQDEKSGQRTQKKNSVLEGQGLETGSMQSF